MKNLKLFAPAILMATVITLITGCSDISGASVGKTGSISAEKRTIKAEVVDFDKYFVREESNARSINPAAWTLADAGSNINFYLYGEATNGEKYNTDFSKSIAAAKIDSNGNFDLELDAYNWTLTLFACKEAPSSLTTAYKKAALVARAHVDLTNSAMGAIFKLTSVGLTGKGFYDINVKLDGWNMEDKDAAMTATIGIYNRITGAVVDSKEVTGISSSALSSTVAKAFADTATGIPAGVYLFQVKFTNPSTGKIYVYGDTLNIVPQQTTRISTTPADNNFMVPDIIGEKPDAPTNAYALYDTTSLETAQFPDYYTAAIVWTDASANERFFELQLQEVSPNATTPTTWNDQYIYGEGIIEETTLYAAGSLLSGNEEILLRLPLGKRYAARIRATNDAGFSDWVPVAIATDSEVAAGAVAGITSGNEGYFTSWDKTTKGDAIGLLRMIYKVQGGTYTAVTSDIVWMKDDGTGTPTATGASATAYNARFTIEATAAASKYTKSIDYTVYYSKLSTDTDGYPLWGFKDNALQCNSYPVTSWCQDSTTGTKYVPGTDTYLGSDNVVYYANFTPQGQIQIVENKAILEPEATWVTIKGPTDTAAQALASATKHTVTDGNDHKIVFNVTVPASLDTALGDDEKYDSIQIQVKKVGTTRVVYNSTKFAADLSANGTATEFPTWTNVADGVYTVTITFKEGPEIRSLADIVLIVEQ